MPELITSVPCAEPLPSESTNIILEQTFEYWNRYRSTRISRLIMQGIRYKYKLRKQNMANIIVYELCIHEDKEVNSVKDIRKLHREVRDKAILNSLATQGTRRRATST